MTVEEMKRRVLNELDSARSSVEYIKSDDIVDDDACDNVVTVMNNVIDILNQFDGGDKLKFLKALPPGPNQ